MVIIGFNIPYNSPGLSKKKVTTSPFTLWVYFILFYFITMFGVSLFVHSNPVLTNQSFLHRHSVFLKAGGQAGASFMNVVLLTSILSAGNHALFAGTRVLYGLATCHQAPRIFLKTNKNQVPWVALLAVASVSLIFFGASFLKGGAAEIWNWAQNLVGVSNLLAWLCIGSESMIHLSFANRVVHT